MTKKKKEIPMPEISKKWYQKIPWKKILVGMLIGASIGLTINLLRAEKNYIHKNVINSFVCKIVGADPEANMFAVECLSR